jgi:HAE1 family hydrophobic/amphiphilic exporter-1
VPPGLEGGLGDSLGGLADGDFDDARIGLVFELPLGNRAARAAAEIAANTERQAEAELVRARKAVRAEVLDAAAALETAGGRIEASRAAREAAEVQLMAERERFAVGLSTNFLVLTRQNDLAGARLDEIAALTDYRTARTELGRATGALLAERGIELQTTE